MISCGVEKSKNHGTTRRFCRSRTANGLILLQVLAKALYGNLGQNSPRVRPKYEVFGLLVNFMQFVAAACAFDDIETASVGGLIHSDDSQIVRNGSGCRDAKRNRRQCYARRPS